MSNLHAFMPQDASQRAHAVSFSALRKDGHRAAPPPLDAAKARNGLASFALPWSNRALAPPSSSSPSFISGLHLPTTHEDWTHPPSIYTSRLSDDLISSIDRDTHGSHRHRSTSSAAAVPHHLSRASPSSAAAHGRSPSVWSDADVGRRRPGTWQPDALGGALSGSLRDEVDGELVDTSRSGEQTAIQSPAQRGRDLRPPSHVEGGGGSESRRHSIAAAPGAFSNGSQRRAVGFDIPSQVTMAARTTSVGPRPSQVPTPRAGGPSLFSSGGLAFSEDDLVSDLSMLHLNLNEVAEKQKAEAQAQERLANSRLGQINMRVPSSIAAATGEHAASMPSRLGEQEYALGNGTNLTKFGSPWSARPRQTDMAASWDLRTPSSSSPQRQNGAELYSRPGPIGSAIDSESVPIDRTYSGTRGRTPSVSSSVSARSNSRGPLSPQGHNFGAIDGHPPTPAWPTHLATAHAGPHYPSEQFDLFHEPQLRAGLAGHPRFGQAHAPGVQLPFDGVPGQTQLPHHLAIGAPRKLAPANLQPLPDTTLTGLATLGPIPVSGSGPAGARGNEGPAYLQEFGKGVPLHSLPPSQQLFLCGFKADRTDIFFKQPSLTGGFSEEEQIGVGDLVVVEGDRGKDIGNVINCSITAEQVEHFLAHQNELLALAGKADGSLGRPIRAISPKRLFHKATSAELSMLPSKAQDEEKALQLVQTKVIQRGLPMQVVAAEFQWDHRKLTIYYQSSQRVDFRDLVKELFRLYKSRIWLVQI